MSSSSQRHILSLRPALSVILSALVLMLLGYYLHGWSIGLMDALEDYRSPIREELPHGERLDPLTSRLVLVIIGGLQIDALGQMPWLTGIADKGSLVIVHGAPPTLAANAWTTILSGATPALSGATYLDHDPQRLLSIAHDHIVAAAQRAGVRTRVLGDTRWQELLSDDASIVGAVSDGNASAEDQQVLQEAASLLQDHPPDFLIVYLGELAEIASSDGTSGQPYRDAVSRTDMHLGAFVSGLDLNKHTLVVISDHGHTRQGGRGGRESQVTNTPMVLIGPGILAGQTGTASQSDLAPTFAALLGTQIPSMAEGRFLDGLLTWDTQHKAQAWISLAHQQAMLTKAYLRGIGSLAPGHSFESQFAEIEDTAAEGGWEQTHGLASEIVSGSEGYREDARRLRESREQRERSWILPAFLLPVTLYVWRCHYRQGMPVIMAAVMVAGVSHLLFLTAGRGYSFSAIREIDTFFAGAAVRTILGLACGWLWLCRSMWRAQVPEAVRLISASLRLGWLAGGLLFAPAVTMFWWIGPIVSWTLPDMTMLFVLFLSLNQAAAVALAAPALAILGTLAALLTSRVWISRRKPQGSLQ